MKKFILPTGGTILASLALMLLLTVTACDNDDDLPIQPGVLAFQTNVELRVAAGEVVTIQPTFQPYVSAPKGTTWSWKIVSVPENSKAGLKDDNQSTAGLQTDLSGKYQLELTGTFGQQVLTDTLIVKAFDETKVEGGYQTLFKTDGTITKLYASQDRLYAAGSFNQIGDLPANHIAFYDGTEWKPMGLGMQEGSAIADMIEFQGDLYVVGYFTGPEGVTSPAISRWGGTDWKAVPGLEVLWLESDWGEYLANSGTSLKIFQDQLYIAGSFKGENLGPLDDYSVIKWDGNQLTGVSGNFNSVGGPGIHLELFNNQLVVFNLYKSNSLAFYDGSGWKELNVPVNPNRYSLGINLVSYREKLLINAREGTYITTGDFYGEQIISDFYILNNDQLQEVFSPANFMNTLEVVGDVLYTGGEHGIITWDGRRWGVAKDGAKFSISATQSFQNQLFVAGTFGEEYGSSIAVLQPSD